MSGSGATSVSRAPQQSLKRKPERNPDIAHRKKRRVDAQNARVIAAQTTGKAFGDGQVDVDKFVRARQFEIKALEDAMQRSKKAHSNRAFQNVPKDLRRRTASHNAKRVPKRLRAKAVREMIEDNTPTGKSRLRKPNSRNRLRLDTVKRLKTLQKDAGSKGKARQITKTSSMSADRRIVAGASTPSGAKEDTNESVIRARAPRVKKNKLAKPITPKAKFRKRQIHKAWLPTHLFHAKRAHMTPPKEPLWRMAIPLSPTAKSYRATHRASTANGAVAWDTSYMSTIRLEGPQDNILEILKKLGVGYGDTAYLSSSESSRWVAGSRSWDGWLYEPDSLHTSSIAPAKVFWIASGHSDGSARGKSTFSARSQTKIVKRTAIVRIHPSAFLQFWQVLLTLAKAQRPPVAVEDLRFEIGSIEIMGPASTEALVGVLRPCQIATGAHKPLKNPAEFWDYLGAVRDPASLPPNSIINMDISDPRLHHRKHCDASLRKATSHQRLLQILAAWPLDRDQNQSHLFDRSRRLTACRQLPSQKAINRRRAAVAPNELPEPIERDPEIPVTLLTAKPYGSTQGTWTLLMPWKCVLPIWYCLMYYPLASGGTVNFGGLEQKRQIGLETGTPWFPADFPGTKAGTAWEEQQRAARKADWEKRPKGKRIEWTALDLGHDRKGELGSGWACDWDILLQSEAKNMKESPIPSLSRIPASIATSKLRHNSPSPLMGNALHGLLTVKIEMVSRGIPTTCARVYRLPSTNQADRERWLSVLHRPSKYHADEAASAPLGFGETKNAPPHVRHQHLAASLLRPENLEKEHPAVPGEHDLIGFVTTGCFNLSKGKGVAIGSILLSKAVGESHGDGSVANNKERHLCIVRDAGQPTGRLARWSVTS